MANQLNVGDKIALESNYGGVSIYTIDRVTEKRAYSGNQAFQREYRDKGFGTIVPSPKESGWGRRHFTFANEKHFSEIENQKLKNWFRSFQPTTEQIKSIHQLFGTPENGGK